LSVPRRYGEAVSADLFSSVTRAWFESAFPAPTKAQAQGWPSISSGGHTLICAPTGSGKTLAAFLWAIDRIVTMPQPPKKAKDGKGCRVLYISPLRALAVDVEKNLRTPIKGIKLAGERLGIDVSPPSVAIRTGDTDPKERRLLLREPPDILITTPESLYLMLTSSARETLRTVDTVIVDEIHAVAQSKRGTHLMLSLERLDEITETPPQRIGLSATQRPLSEIARFLGGQTPDGPRPVTIVDAGMTKELDVEVIVPVEDMAALDDIEPMESGSGYGTRRSIWPAIHPKILELVQAHRSTIVFVNARRMAERLAARLNELAAETSPDAGDIAKAHHGSLAREQRLIIEDDLKSGRLRCLVATSSLELGIDMGAVDLVVQVESPGSVARGMQRIGRAGHRVDEPSRGKLFPKYRGDLLEAAVVTKRMRAGQIEETSYPRNPLDVLAQQIVAMCAVDEWKVDDLAAVVRRSAPYAELTDDVLHAVLDLLSGRYPSTEFAELRPRIVWDRRHNVLTAREGAKRLAVTSGGTIPDRGLFGVFLPDGKRVGELDEEMVYESRPGETFVLGASTWRIEDITRDRVVVTPAPGEPAKMPFWKGDKPGRPLELGRAIGATVRELRDTERKSGTAASVELLQRDYSLDELAAGNLMAYLAEQAETAGTIPDDRTIVIERFRDEIGDWRLCILSPFGARVHAPWAMALQARLAERMGSDLQIMWSDDGIILRLGEAYDDVPVDELCPSPDEVEELLTSELPSTAMFASLFREAAARALLLPRRRPDKRTPLWQQRQRSADLLQVASKYPTFPILLETTRECVRDVFDLPALKEVLRDVRSRKVRVASVETKQASPFAQSLLFGWIAVYMYEGDTPPAERRAAALALDPDLLRELLGTEELRELIDPDALATIELDLQKLSDGRRAENADELHDVLREIGDLTPMEVDIRCDGATPERSGGAESAAWIDSLVEQRRAILLNVAGEQRVAAAEDAARYRDALGAALPIGLPQAFTEPVDDPLTDLVGRYARTHGPFLARDVAARFGVATDRVLVSLERLLADDRLVRGEFRPDGTEREWCDVAVLRQLRRRSLARLRKEIEAVEPSVLGRFLPAWQSVTAPREGPDALVEVISQLQGASIPASVLESDVLPSRLGAYRPADLDALCASGELVWIGAGPLGPADGKVVLLFRDQLPLLAPSPADERPSGELHEKIRTQLASAGASFWTNLVTATGVSDEKVLLPALWDLVWSGEVTNDTLAPLRALAWGKPNRARGGKPRPGSLRRTGPPTGAGRWSLVGAVHTGPRPSPTQIAHAKALQLLDRHGVLTREAVLAEGVEGGFSSVYGILRAMEDSGRVRRGYFVAGLGAAQFALPGAVERLRELREPDSGSAIVLAATDPAQPYGAALSWPESSGRPARAAGAYVVLVGGECAAYLERGGRSLLTFEPSSRSDVWAEALASLQKEGRVKRLVIERIDGAPAADAPGAEVLREVGFADSYRGLTLRG
jgi:ATP-dependent Lhr-like helicase